jgi:hypothetical protein
MAGASPLPGYLCQVNLASGASIPGTDLVLTDAGDHQTFTVPLASIKRYIDPNTAVVVQTTTDGSTWTTAGANTLRYLTAQVVLTVALSGGTSYGCRLHTFNYIAYAAIIQATDITFQPTRVMNDGTTLQGASGAGFMTYIPGLMSGSYACKTWQLNTGATVFTTHWTAGDLVIVSFVAPDGVHAFEASCYLSDTNIQGAVASLAAEDLTFHVTGIIAIL